MVKTSELRQREVINILDGKRLGFVADLDIDLDEGKIKSIIIPSQSRVFGLFTRSGDYIIPWEKIKKIGSDVILVELNDFLEPHKSIKWDFNFSSKNIIMVIREALGGEKMHEMSFL